jgi:SAM-dependent methyltransferase
VAGPGGATGDPAAIWALGDYTSVAERLLPVAERTVASLGLSPGERVLDVATGNGNAAMLAARAGAIVTGVDLSDAQLELARSRLSQEGVEVGLERGDAQDLPFPDGGFDAVVSVLGAMFAPDADRAAGELARVCRPGGRVAVASWTDDTWMRTWRERLPTAVDVPAPPPAPPDRWTDPEVVRSRLRAAGIAAEVEVHTLMWRFADAEQAADFYTSSVAPFVAFASTLDAQRLARARALMLDIVRESDVSGGSACELPSGWVLAVGRRDPGT